MIDFYQARAATRKVVTPATAAMGAMLPTCKLSAAGHIIHRPSWFVQFQHTSELSRLQKTAQVCVHASREALCTDMG